MFKPPRIGTCYADAAASLTVSPQQSTHSAVPEPSFLPTHCLVPLHFEHKKQPRRRCKDRSLKSYRAFPQRITMRDRHASRTKKEALARHNSRAVPRRHSMPIGKFYATLLPMLDPCDWEDYLDPPPPSRSGRAIRVQ